MMAVTQPSAYNSGPHQINSSTFNFMNNGGVFVHSNPPKPLISASSSTSSTQNTTIRNWVKSGDVDKLENVVLEGQGARLLGLMDSTSDMKVKTFLRGIPGYMAKVDLIHDAVIRGSVRELQTLLDKKKLSLARDAVGRGLAHKAVLHSQKNVLDWLGKKYPEAIQIRDNESRTCLHYSGISKNPTDMYNFLLNLGSNPEVIDIHGRKASYYLTNPQELYIEGVSGGGGGRGFRNKFRGSNNKFNRRRISPISPKSSPSPPITSMGSQNSGPQHSSAGAITSKSGSQASPTNSSITRAQIRIWIHEKDISKLERIVWSGNGDKLLLETTNNPKVRRFLDNVPYLLHHIKLIHTAAIHNDVDGLKEIRSRIEQTGSNTNGDAGGSIAPELFTARDAYGLSALHKATGLNNRASCEYLLYEFGNSLNLQDNFNRASLHYAATRVSNDQNSPESIYKFLLRAGATSSVIDYKHHEAEYYLTHPNECDSFKFLRNIPDAPRVLSSDRVLLGWDRSGVTRSPGTNKRKISSGDEFGESVGRVPILLPDDSAKEPEERAVSSSKVARTEEDEQIDEQQQPEAMSEDEQFEADFEDEIVDVGDGYVADSDEGKYELSEDVVIIDGVVEESQQLNDNVEEEEEEKRMTTPNEVEKSEEKSDEKTDDEKTDEEKSDEKTEEEKSVVPVLEEPTAPPEEEEKEPEETAEEPPAIEDTLPPPDYDSVLDGPQDSTVDDLIESADMESLVNLVLKGQGAELSSKSSDNPEIQEFLLNVPAYMAKISSIHNAAYTGNMRDLQSLLDRKRLAEAQDSSGRGPLHHAVLGGNSQVVRYLVNGYPGCVDLVDWNGRTALHYAAAVQDSGGLFKVLIQAGADPNVRDALSNTPGVYLRRKDLISVEELAKGGSTVASNGSVDTWERPTTPFPERNESSSVIMIPPPPPDEDNEDEQLEVAVSNLSLLNGFYLEVLSKESESIWSRTWKKLSSGNNTEIANKYVKRYLSPQVFHKVKTRCTPRYGATLLDCIKFYPQFFVVAPDPHAYTSFSEVFIPAICEANFGGGGLGTQHCPMVLQGEAKLLTDYPIVDLPSKFVHQVRVRVSRNIRPFPFIPIMKREDLYEVQKIVKRAFSSFEWFELEGMEKDQRDQLVENRGVWFPEATKISRFWPKGRGFLINESGSVCVWVNAEDHVDVIVQSQYGKLHPVMEILQSAVDKFVHECEFHYNSQCGFLTVDPFRCGTGLKITFRLRLPNLMQNRSYTTQKCEELKLSLKWKQKYRLFGPSNNELSPDDWIEVENTQTCGVDENEIVTRVISSVSELIRDEEEKARAIDRSITKKKENGSAEK